MANIANQQVIGGHTANIVLDGVVVGFCQGVTWTLDMGAQDVFVLGDVSSQETQQTRYAVKGELTRYFIRKNISDSSALGARTAADMITKGTFDLQVIDTTSGSTIQTLVNCTLANASGGVQTGQLVNQRYSFNALATR